jgi:daunorubicin resistance ABC transporter ATP-binding subunit
MGEPGIEMTGIVKRFGATVALDGLSLRAEAGTIVGLLGPNGAGKTTTIEVLSTLTHPDQGTARVAGYDVCSEAAVVRSVIGLTGQFAALEENMTARENLVLFGRLLKLGKAGARARAAELLAQFDLNEAADRRVTTFSGGTRRRLDLAVSMLAEPAVLFLDEPTTGLDPRSRVALWARVRDLRDRGMTILLTTQQLEEADTLADWIVVIDHGRVIAEGTAAMLKARVGGTVCHVVVSDAARDRAAAALAPLGDVAHLESGLTVPAEGPGALAEVIRRLDAAQVHLDDLVLRRPTLDDVFFALTGHGADEGSPGSADPGEPPLSNPVQKPDDRLQGLSS